MGSLFAMCLNMVTRLRRFRYGIAFARPYEFCCGDLLQVREGLLWATHESRSSAQTDNDGLENLLTKQRSECKKAPEWRSGAFEASLRF